MEPSFGLEEANALYKYMKEGGWATEFKKTRKFEDQIREKTGSKFCFVVNNGTIALSCSLLSVGVQPGDEVIVPDLTMIATANAARLIGAVPVLVDVEPIALGLDPPLVNAAITERTKAIVFVSLNGRCGQLEAIDDICANHQLPLIEDAAQSLGSYIKKRHLGTIGKAGILSFSSQKIISTGQGGAVMTQDSALANEIKKLKDFGRLSGGNDIHDFMGYNFKFTDVQATIGIEQMKKLTWRIMRKKHIYRQYYTTLQNITMQPDVSLLS